MDNITIATTPNWFLNQVLSVNHECSLFAYCVRTEIVVLRNANAPSFFGIDYKTIQAAHKDRASGLMFSPVKDPIQPFYKHLVSFGDDGIIKIWNLKNARCMMMNNAHMKQIESGHKIVGIDWLKTDPHVIVSVSDNAIVVRWALEANSVKQFIVKGRIFPQCISASPHDKDIVAIGSKCGHVVVFSMKAGTSTGSILGRVRCGDNDIMSMSWCPVPIDVIYKKTDKDPKYLVVGSKDYGVYIVETNRSTSKVKNDCVQLIVNVFLPKSALNKNNNRFSKSYKKDHGWSVVCWNNPFSIIATSKFAEVISFQTESMYPGRDGLQFKFKLVHDRHSSKPVFSLACPQTSEIEDNIDQVVWTIAVDRHLIRHSLNQSSLTLDLNTCTSYVYCLALSMMPDQSRLAIGLGEGKIFIWNMYKTTYLDLAEYWQKIEGKVMTLSFHPEKEGWLAYGTSYGLVGLLDISSRNKSPSVIYSLENTQAVGNKSEKMAVYCLTWGPNVLPVNDEKTSSTESFCLYAVSNGDIFMFTPSSKVLKATSPISLKPYLDKIDSENGLPENTRRSDMVWKPDFSMFAVANESGSIYILSLEFTCIVTLLEHKRLINSMAWHPNFILSCDSPYKNWLATGSDVIKVFNIDPDNVSQSRQPIATLSLHSQRITCVTWNPHVNGQLLSTSYDHVAQVWDVVNQTPLVSYLGHLSHVMAGLWSPLDPNVVITSSADGTVQSWKISNQTTVRPCDKRNLKVDASSIPVAALDATCEEKQIKVVNKNDKRKPKPVFPITGIQLNHGAHLNVLVNRYIQNLNLQNPVFVENANNNTIEKDKDSLKNGIPEEATTNGHGSDDSDPNVEKAATVEETDKDEFGSLYLNFFGNREDMAQLVQKELTLHLNNKLITNALGTSLWLGDFNKVVKMAMEKEELTDEIVALSQTASLKLWRDCCEAYAKQLISAGYILKATNYLLAIHKIEDAVRLLLDNYLFKEALSLAKLRLPENHELVKSGYEKWADHASTHGNYALAAHIYLLLGNGVSAMQVLNKSNDVKFQYYGCVLALNNPAMPNAGKDMLNSCFKRCLENVRLTIAKEVIEAHPLNKYFSLWYHGRQRCAEMLEKENILSSWLNEKKDQENILEKISNDVKDINVSISDVNELKNLVNICESMDKAKVLLYISGHLAIASVSSSVDHLKHILLALKVAYKMQFRIIVFPALFNAALYPNGPLESYPLLDKSNSANADYTQSIRAFLCDSVVNWLHYGNVKNQNQEKLFNLLEKTVETYIEDVINIDSVQYFKAQNDIVSLEAALCQQIVKDQIIRKVDSVENLSLFKNTEIKKNQSVNENSLRDKLSSQSKFGTLNNEVEETTKHEKFVQEEGNEDNNAEVLDKQKNQENGEIITGDKQKNQENGEIIIEDKQKNQENGESIIEDEQKYQKNGENNTKDEQRNQEDSKNVVETLNEKAETKKGTHKVPEFEDNSDESNKQTEKSVDALLGFEKATNPNYDITRAVEDLEGEGNNEEELQTTDEKLQRLKELREIVANFESSRIYSPNPSNVFDSVFKILKTINTEDVVIKRRINELVALMNTYAETFKLA